MRRWVGLGVICDTLINISCALLQKAWSVSPSWTPPWRSASPPYRCSS